MSDIPLGKSDSYKAHIAPVYSPDLLFAISRKENRDNLGIKELPFSGYDRWNAYEFSWLSQNNVPKIAKLLIDIPCNSIHIVESKSLKLYLNSFSFSRFKSTQDLLAILQKDLDAITQAKVKITLCDLSGLEQQGFSELKGVSQCIDTIPLAYASSNSISAKGCIGSAEKMEDEEGENRSEEDNENNLSLEFLNANTLNEAEFSSKSDLTLNDKAKRSQSIIQETVHSHLFRSLCPVTAQPDWASIVIRYEGLPISHEAILRYLLSFRNHQGFHEDCVERIFCDFDNTFQLNKLSVYAAFLRRGGIDINPFRSNFESVIPFGRLIRQ